MAAAAWAGVSRAARSRGVARAEEAGGTRDHDWGSGGRRSNVRRCACTAARGPVPTTGRLEVCGSDKPKRRATPRGVAGAAVVRRVRATPARLTSREVRRVFPDSESSGRSAAGRGGGCSRSTEIGGFRGVIGRRGELIGLRKRGRAGELYSGTLGCSADWRTVTPESHRLGRRTSRRPSCPASPGPVLSAEPKRDALRDGEICERSRSRTKRVGAGRPPLP